MQNCYKNYICNCHYYLRSLFQIDITQSKGVNNKCNAKGFWQNELVAEQNFDCPNNISGLGLYIAGGYTPFNGQVRNFSYIKK